MDLHNINTTYPCRCKKGGVPSKEKRIICKRSMGRFPCFLHPPSGKCVVYLCLFHAGSNFLCCRNTFVRRSKTGIKECA
jgi:hypothetical protein